MKQSIILLIICICVLGVQSCNVFEQEGQRNPISPSFERSEYFTNFYISQGSGNTYGFYTRPGILVVNIPEAGDYVIIYTTTWGTFEIVFRAQLASLLFIGLHPDDEVSDIGIVSTTITADESIGEQVGGVFVFSRPGIPRAVSQITILPKEADNTLLLLVAPPTGVKVTFLLKGGIIQNDVVEIPEDVVFPPPPNTELFVDGNAGQDTNTCTSASTSCKTIGKALEKASNGQTIYINTGIYANESWPLTISTANITLKGTGKSTVIIDSTANTFNNALEVNTSGVTLRDLMIQAKQDAVRVLSGGIRVIDATLSSHGTDGSGFFLMMGGAILTNTDVSIVTSLDAFSSALSVHGTLKMTGGTVTFQCNRTTGAGIFVGNNSIADLTGVTVTTNFAKALWTSSGASVSITNSTLTSPSGEHTIALDYPIHTGSKIINISGTTLNGATMAGKYNLFCQDNNSVTSGGGNTVNGNGTSGCNISGIWP